MDLKELLEEKFKTKRVAMIESLQTSLFESDCECGEDDEEECDCDVDMNEAADPAFKKQVKQWTDSKLIKQLKKYRNKDEDKYETIVSELDFRGISESLEEDFIDVFLNEETGEQYYIDLCEETLQERKIIIKVNSKGQRTRKIKCPPGKVMKSMNGKKVCATPSGSERLSKKLSIKQSNRTKKAKGSGYKKRTNFKRQKAMKKRRAMGL